MAPPMQFGNLQSGMFKSIQGLSFPSVTATPYGYPPHPSSPHLAPGTVTTQVYNASTMMGHPPYIQSNMYGHIPLALAPPQLPTPPSASDDRLKSMMNKFLEVMTMQRESSRYSSRVIPQSSENAAPFNYAQGGSSFLLVIEAATNDLLDLPPSPLHYTEQDLQILEQLAIKATKDQDEARRQLRSSTQKASADSKGRYETMKPAPKATAPHPQPTAVPAPLPPAPLVPAPAAHHNLVSMNSPQFQFANGMDSAKATSNVTDTFLNTLVTLPLCNILGASPGICKAMTELTCLHKITTDLTPVTSAMQDLFNSHPNLGHEESLDSMHAQDLIPETMPCVPIEVEQFLASLSPPDGARFAARHTELLQTIECLVEGKLKIHAILDDRSQIIGMWHAIWEKLGIPSTLHSPTTLRRVFGDFVKSLRGLYRDSSETFQRLSEDSPQSLRRVFKDTAESL
ncbi:hypothetical protein FA15DRAFT_711425 [Coprinopsis marcescibilis]|uniref:Uncharacterized protein n=1 Tax=Coprinopsis marcescibilis TaxID=230819 RepID=A0A5C3KAX4_COPMA|nr:hypothetical protein FA15DRAFT_711425 [Coprinopsis marcescibilis]